MWWRKWCLMSWVSRALAQWLDQRMGCGCCVSFRQLRTCRGTLPGQQRAISRHLPTDVNSDQAALYPGVLRITLHRHGHTFSASVAHAVERPLLGPTKLRRWPPPDRRGVLPGLACHIDPPPRVGNIDPRTSQRIEKIDQIRLLPFGESDAEPLVVKIHRVRQRRRRAVVKVRRAGGQAAQDG